MGDGSGYPGPGKLESEKAQSSSRGVQALAVRVPFMLDALNVIDQGILIISNDGHILYYNAAYAHFRQITLDGMIGCSHEELDYPRDMMELLQRGALPRDKTVAVDGHTYRESLTVVEDGQGDLLGVVVMVTATPEAVRVVAPIASRRSNRKVDTEPAWPARFAMPDVIGNSPALTHVKDLALQAAQGGSSVLLLGESGTGKEMFAHAIHTASRRRDLPFVPIDCSAIPKELLEAELFGYAPGAFTGASKEGKPGRFELARGGTVLLDEIGELPLELQSKLLRVLQERQIVRVGGTVPIPVNFRLIAATNRDLENLVAQGLFRRDLMYRLDIIRIDIPPLRERPEDIPLIVEYYWELKQQETGKVVKLSADALRAMEEYLWPGNVRELANMVERLLVTSSKPVVELHDLPPIFHQRQVRPLSFIPFQLELIAADAERRALERAIAQTKGNRNKAAQLVGLSRATFYRKLKRYNLIDPI